MHQSRSLQSKFFIAIIAFLKTVTAANNIVDSQQHVFLNNQPALPESWNFNFSSSAPHYFASVQGLLQQWPNTFFPNGHSIAPVEIAPYTKFYHGRTDPDLPESPEWLSFDIEMAYGIMGSFRNSHMITYTTTKPIKAIYFDGESATLMGAGRMDTQMLQIYLNTSGPPLDRHRRFGLAGEYDRASGLCGWIKEKGLGGLGWGFEGIVRMNAGFEMIWCQFESPSLKVVSHLNITAPLLPEPGTTSLLSKSPSAIESTSTIGKLQEDPQEQEKTPPYKTSYFPLPPEATKTTIPTIPKPPPNWRPNPREPFLRSQGWGWFTSATNHYGFSGMGPGYGEARIKPLTCAVMNYYSPVFQSQAVARADAERKSLNLTSEGLWIGPVKDGDREVALKQLMRRRRSHRLNGVSISDASAMKAASEVAFSKILNGTAKCSGLDWAVLTNEIVQTHATDLFNFLHLLKTLEGSLELKNETEVRSELAEIRSSSHKFLMPFFEYPSGSSEETQKNKLWKTSSNFAQETYSRCRYHHTRLLSPEFDIHLNPQENTLKWAVEETVGGICQTIIGVGFGVEEIWEFANGENLKVSLAKEVKWWREGVEELMSWLGWAGNWVRCEKVCEWNERCFVPMWPMIARVWPKMNENGEGDGPLGDRPEPPRDGSPPWQDDDIPGGKEPRPPRKRPGKHPGGGGEGGGGGGGGGPGWSPDETDLWEPKCINVDYIMVV